MFENLEKRKRRREQPSDRNSTDAELSVNSEAPDLEEVKTETPETEDGSSALSAAAPNISNSTSSTGVNTRRSSQVAVRWKWNCLIACTELIRSMSDCLGWEKIWAFCFRQHGCEVRQGWPGFYPVLSLIPPRTKIAQPPWEASSVQDCSHGEKLVLYVFECMYVVSSSNPALLQRAWLHFLDGLSLDVERLLLGVLVLWVD